MSSFPVLLESAPEESLIRVYEMPNAKQRFLQVSDTLEQQRNEQPFHVLESCKDTGWVNVQNWLETNAKLPFWDIALIVYEAYFINFIEWL